MRKRRLISKTIDWVILSHGMLALVFALATATWIVFTWLRPPEHDVGSQPLALVLAFVGFAPLVLIAAQRRGEIVRGEATDRLRALYFISSGLSLAAVWIFFNSLAHTIGLWAGSVLFLLAPMILGVLLWVRSRGQ